MKKQYIFLKLRGTYGDLRKSPKIVWEEIQDVASQCNVSRQEAEDALVLAEGDIVTAIGYLNGFTTKEQIKEIIEKKKKENQL